MRKTAIICMLFVSTLFMANSAVAQGMKDMRINEVMAKNLSGLEDSHGSKSGWVELHNTGYSSVDLGGSFLTTSIGDPSKTYRIPRSKSVIVPPRGFIVFFANGLFHESVYNTNFSLYDSTATEGTIALYDASGKGEPISEFKYLMSDQKENVSVGWLEENGKEEWTVLEYATPNSVNSVIDVEPKHVSVKRMDKFGIGISLAAMTVVLLALFCLYLIFRTLGKSMTKMGKKKEAKSDEGAEIVPAEGNIDDLSGEAIAAIAIAIEKYSDELHDIESTVLTINKVARAYSPWSSKLYGMRQLPNKISNKR